MSFKKILKIFSNKKSLKGVNIWISGAVPEYESWSHPLVDRDILEFISIFSSIVFERGGTIIHGSHPTLTPILKRQASRFAKRKNQLSLYICEKWYNEEHEKIPYYKVISSVVTNAGFDRDSSLSKLRIEMAKVSNVAVFIGGKHHLSSGFQPGIPEEMEWAKKFKIHSYILGGVDGAAQEFLSDDQLKSMNFNSNLDVLKSISYEKNIYLLPSIIVKDILYRKDQIY